MRCFTPPTAESTEAGRADERRGSKSTSYGLLILFWFALFSLFFFDFLGVPAPSSQPSGSLLSLSLLVSISIPPFLLLLVVSLSSLLLLLLLLLPPA